MPRVFSRYAQTAVYMWLPSISLAHSSPLPFLCKTLISLTASRSWILRSCGCSVRFRIRPPGSLSIFRLAMRVSSAYVWLMPPMQSVLSLRQTLRFFRPATSTFKGAQRCLMHSPTCSFGVQRMPTERRRLVRYFSEYFVELRSVYLNTFLPIFTSRQLRCKMSCPHTKVLP